MSTDTIQTDTISFTNGSQAVSVLAPVHASAQDVVAALQLHDHSAVIIILGGSAAIEDARRSRLVQLFDRGIVRAAAQANAVIVDGGTEGGIISLIGEGVASRGHKTPLIGVAQVETVSYPGSATTGIPLEPNHSHFILTDGAGEGSKKEMTLEVVKAISRQEIISDGAVQQYRQLPVVAVLAGGELAEKHEVLFAVRQNLPVIIFEGSGGMADEIAAAYKQKDVRPDDPLIAEIVEDGDLHFHALSNSVKGIERLIIRELGIDNVLLQAWETFADYDHNANLQQKRFDVLQLSIIVLGVVGTALAIIQQVSVRDVAGKLVFPWNVLHQVLILIPVTLTILITAANRFKQGTKWLLLRAGAEAIKREIYRYRTRAMYYKSNPEQQLAKKVEDITLRTMRTEVNLSSLIPYDKNKGFPPYMFAAIGGDDGFSCLTPDKYVDVRLGDQLNYFKKASVRLEKQLKRLYWLTFVIGGVGTYLAAIDLQIWIALTTSIVAAFGTYLGYRQTESTLTKYNQAATDLANVKSWWNALSAEEQAQQVNIDSLVEHTEQVLQSELDGWIQQMQNALAELRKGQEVQPEKEENKEPAEKLNTPTNAGSTGNNEKADSDKETKSQTTTPVVDPVILESLTNVQTPAEPVVDNDEPPADSSDDVGATAKNTEDK